MKHVSDSCPVCDISSFVFNSVCYVHLFTILSFDSSFQLKVD